MGGAVIDLARTERHEARGRRQARRAQREVDKARRRDFVKAVDVEALAIAGEREGFFFGRHALAFAAPTEDLQSLFRHGFLPTGFPISLPFDRLEVFRPTTLIHGGTFELGAASGRWRGEVGVGGTRRPLRSF
jgi:hypothetical protein